ncbi:hypothetical protein [Phytohalomonas tamaricis]|uniref:hypothetical protein n=1 Tax=Phytohalomonas tamaricis TaxID=2081032 RepID=UPI000D0AED98|nr:hypothetical protein [Phytohalomonas tamaricis]
MSSANEMQQARIIKELRSFIKKLLQEPSILEKSLEIAREHHGQPGATAKIANEISATTHVKIPEDAADHSPADKLYLEVLKEVVEEERAMY